MAQDVAWFDDEADGERHAYACAAVDRIRGEQTYRESVCRLAWELYTRKPTSCGADSSDLYEMARGPFNVIKRGVNTLLSEFALHKPRPEYLTSGADYDGQQKAKQAGKFCDGMYYAVAFDAKIAPQVRRDAMLFGDGFTQWEVVEGAATLSCERVFPLEIVVDEGDLGSDDEPMTFFRERFFDRRKLAKLFPKHKEEIKKAAGWKGDHRWWHTHGPNVVRVVQSWRRASGPDAKDGRWITCIDGLTLDEGEWPYEWVPICAYHWSRPVRGYYGESVVEQILENQREVDFLSDIIRRTLRRALPKIGVAKEAEVPDEAITNEEFAIIRFEREGGPPVPLTLVSVSSELYNERREQVRAAYDELGLSELAVSSQIPAGLTGSGVSQTVYADQKSKRQLEPLDAHEEWYLDNARTMIRLIRHAASNDNAYEVVYRARGHIERIAWSEIDIDEQHYVMKAMPVSKLPSTPAAKYAVLDEWLAKGLIDPAGYKRMAGIPDLEAETAIENAAREHAEFVVNEILTKGVDWEPHNIMKLDVQLTLGGLMYLDAERRGASEANLAKLRLFLAECENLFTEQQGGGAPEPPMPAGAGPEGPPPVPGPEGAPDPTLDPELAAMAPEAA